jgi:hypothetical protein
LAAEPVGPVAVESVVPEEPAALQAAQKRSEPGWLPLAAVLQEASAAVWFQVPLRA